jgi:hypothetical protein
MADITRDIPATCTYIAYGCTSGKAPIGAVLDPATNEVAFVMYSCEDCMAEQAYSDWHKDEYGSRPHWMTREQKIEAWWAMPEIAGVRG